MYDLITVVQNKPYRRSNLSGIDHLLNLLFRETGKAKGSHHPTESETLLCKKYRNEQLFLSVNHITQESLKSRQNDRVNIPFSDKEALATYYFVCQKKDWGRLKPIFTVV